VDCTASSRLAQHGNSLSVNDAPRSYTNKVVSADKIEPAQVEKQQENDDSDRVTLDPVLNQLSALVRMREPKTRSELRAL
jgi:hypothetical protein